MPDAAQLEQLPTAATAFMHRRDRDAEFELVVRSLVDGLYARLRVLA